MKKLMKMKAILLFALLLPYHGWVMAAPPGPCQGPNKNDPGCPGAEEPPPAAAEAAVVDSVTVDWLNLALVVRGSGLTGVTEFLLGSSATPLGTANVTDSQVELPFDSILAAEAAAQGNYNLVVDGIVALSVYIEAPILDPAATGCPCGADWASQLGGLWGPQETDCFELEGPAVNDAADIAGTILTDPLDSTVYPWYPIGASFYPGVPADSYCALDRIEGDATVTELVRFPINENQQADCAALLETNVCAP
jgi:hypothetical protein